MKITNRLFKPAIQEWYWKIFLPKNSLEKKQEFGLFKLHYGSTSKVMRNLIWVNALNETLTYANYQK